MTIERVFLDANVLFSAAYRERNGLLRLWQLDGTSLLTSEYALHEARVNLDSGVQRKRLDNLIERLELLGGHQLVSIPDEIILPAKDQPILQAAVGGRANYLLTGDVKHFGALYGETVGSVTILKPADYLKTKTTEYPDS